jgi:hypothetical protein
MHKIILTILLCFALFKAHSTGYYYNGFYYTQTTVIEYEDGTLGYMVFQGIPLNFWIGRIDEQGMEVPNKGDMDRLGNHKEDLHNH